MPTPLTRAERATNLLMAAGIAGVLLTMLGAFVWVAARIVLWVWA